MNGIIIVNKEKDYTSRDVVNIISKTLGTKKVGHTGTLDPLATGVLVITVGKCTKLTDFLTSNYKEYIAEFELGYLTDTLDNTGKVLKTSNTKVSKEKIIKVINSFKKEYNQQVPIYSAVKINGKKLYDYARNNIEVELPSRIVDIKEIEVINIDKTITIRCLVSKGTYIRSLIRDIGNELNTYATMTNLIRTKQGNFKIENSYTLENIKNNEYKLISIEEIFNKYPKVVLSKEEVKKVSNGCILDNICDKEYILFYDNQTLISIYKEYEKNKIKPFIMI